MNLLRRVIGRKDRRRPENASRRQLVENLIAQANAEVRSAIAYQNDATQRRADDLEPRLAFLHAQVRALSRP